MLGWFAETTLVASGLAVVAILASRIRSIGPAVRHALWLVVLIKMMTPPLVYWPWAIPWQSLVRPIMPLSAVTASMRVVADRSNRGGQFSPSPICHNELTPRIEPASSWNNFVPRRSDAYGLAEAEVVATTAHSVPSVWRLDLANLTRLDRWVVPAWLVISVVLFIGQASRIIRFRRKLRFAVPAPDDLFEETRRIGNRLGVRMPELLIVPDLDTPLLWCLGRPQLLIPARLVKTIALDRWRGILTHELAHLRRGDQWVSRLELGVGLIWWWNPLYWLTQAHLDANAELACDAWVVWALPKDRLNYAEVLLDICANLAGSPAPTLGVAGSGRFLERRLTMILNDHVSCRLSSLGLLGACLLLLVALPSWSAASLVDVNHEEAATTATMSVTSNPGSLDMAMDDDDDNDDSDMDDDDDDDNDDGDDGDDDDDDRATTGAKRKVEQPKAKIKAKKSGSNDDLGIDLSRLEKEIESKFGPGSEFEKKMEAFGKEIESKFGPGSEFEKKMEAFGKEMESKFGTGSEFERKAEAFGKDVESKFGPGSEFEKKMKAFGEEMKAKYGPKSEFARKIKEQASSDARPTPAPKPEARPRARDQVRERRIQKLEAQISKLVKEIKALKAGTDQVDGDKD